MKFCLYLFLSSLTLCCLGFFYQPYIPIHSDSQLPKANHSIRTINPIDTNYQDLAFLREDLEGVEMIMLGEQYHGDGSTFLAKSRLVKFLHQELDFDVLLFESNIYECFHLWKNITTTTNESPDSFRKALFYFWAEANETKNLRTYIVEQAQSIRPLILGGFDLQLSGDITDLDRMYLIETYLASKNISLKKDYQQLRSTISNYPHWISKTGTEYIKRKSLESTILNELTHLINRLLRSQQTTDDQIFIQYLSGIKTELTYTWTYPEDSIRQSSIRDSMMAANVIWLKEQLYQNKKVILWAANPHVVAGEKNATMANYLKAKYDSLCYSINFTSHFGKTYNFSSNIHEKRNRKELPIGTGTVNGIESMLHNEGQPFVFINLRNSANKTFTMKLWAYHHQTTQWNSLTDGIFYIDQMKPATFN